MVYVYFEAETDNKLNLVAGSATRECLRFRIHMGYGHSFLVVVIDGDESCVQRSGPPNLVSAFSESFVRVCMQYSREGYR